MQKCGTHTHTFVHAYAQKYTGNTVYLMDTCGKLNLREAKRKRTETVAKVVVDAECFQYDHFETHSGNPQAVPNRSLNRARSHLRHLLQAVWTVNPQKIQSDLIKSDLRRNLI